MLNKVATRIQTRLSRKGLKIILGDIKEYLKVNVLDIENITKEEENSTTEYFLSSATKLAVVEELKPMQQFDDVTADIDSINTLSIQEDVEEAIAPPQSAPLATTNKNELVASTAINLGIELSTIEINQIADNFDAGSDDFSETLEQVKSAIIAYVNHKIATNNQRIIDAINEISQVASEGFEDNSQTLSDGFKHLNQQLQQQSTDFKSKLAGTLSRFQLPAAS